MRSVAETVASVLGVVVAIVVALTVVMTVAVAAVVADAVAGADEARGVGDVSSVAHETSARFDSSLTARFPDTAVAVVEARGSSARERSMDDDDEHRSLEPRAP